MEHLLAANLEGGLAAAVDLSTLEAILDTSPRPPLFFKRLMREHSSSLEDAEDFRTYFTSNDTGATTSAYAHLQRAPGTLLEPGYDSSPVSGKLFHASKPSTKAQPAQPMHRAQEE